MSEHDINKHNMSHGIRGQVHVRTEAGEPWDDLVIWDEQRRMAVIPITERNLEIMRIAVQWMDDFLHK